MSSTENEQLNPTSLILVSEPAFLGLVWTCVGLSLLFVLFRLYVRLRVFRRLYDDDFLVVLAWLILLTCTILWHIRKTLELLYESYHIGYAGVLPSMYYLEHLTSWLRILFAGLFLNLVGIWCIKFAFLAFFRRLGRKVKGQKIMWQIVFVFTLAGLAISVGVCYYPCIFATYNYEETVCPRPEAGLRIRRSYRIQLGFDFATDFLIMAIPAQLLWNVKINLKQKIGLLVLFSLTLITMIFAIIRVEVSLRGPREDDLFYFLCATIELTVAILIACIVSYRSFFSPELKARKINKQSATALVNRDTRNNARLTNTEVTGDSREIRQDGDSLSSSFGGDGVEILPLDMIYVTTAFAKQNAGNCISTASSSPSVLLSRHLEFKMIHSTIEINAPPSRVRDVLLTFNAYPTWHTGFITSIASSRESAEKEKDTLSDETDNSAQETNLAAKGDEIHGVMGGVTFTAVVLESSPNLFSWTGPPFYHLFRGVHTFRFSPSVIRPGSTTFVQEESFTGVLAWVMAEKGPIGGKVRGMFEGFNRDLKAEAEKGAGRDG